MAPASMKVSLFLFGLLLQVVTVPSLVHAAVPQNCVDAATAMQSSCGNELSSGLGAVGITGVNPSDINSLVAAVQKAKAEGKLDAAVGAVNPSGGCCKAACSFTRQLCGCNADVVNLVQTGLGLDSGTTGRLLSQFAGKCNFPALSRATGNCPATANFNC